MRKEKKRGVIKAKIKRGDDVVFISGKEYNRYERTADGKVTRVPYRGKVIAVDPKVRKVKVDGAMIVKKHQKPNPQLNVQGGIIKKEAWVDISNISLIDPKTDKPTRVKLEVRDGEKVRIAKSGEVIPNPNPFVKIEKTETEEVAEEAAAEEVVEETEVKEEKPKKKKSKKADKKTEDKSEEE
jgi:large subunit ribosomal protein L24